MNLGRLIGVALALAIAPLISRAQDRIDIVQIWQNFVASGAAAHECGSVDKATEPNFLMNLTSVTIRTAQALKERNPTVSQADLKGKMDAASGQIRDKVETEIKQNGCSSPKIEQLLTMYKVHASMKL